MSDIKTLCGAYRNRFPIGAAIAPGHLQSHAELLKTHFNSITAENCMKFGLIHPAPDLYSLDDADKLADYVRANGIKMRGHTLVWHQQTSDWVFEGKDGGPVSREALLQRMREHINTVVPRYLDAVYCWDVVNEAIEDDGNTLLRRTKWLDIIGEDYLLKAFEYAHEADPNALLFYNDYNETNPAKRDKIVVLLKRLIEQGAPIHGMGMQAHYGPTSPTLDEIRHAIEAYAALGLKVQITEMDISMYKWDQGPSDLTSPTPEMIANQTERYTGIFSLLREFGDVITGVTLWGLADDATWLDHFPVPHRKNWPLLFDEHHQPKEACLRVMEF